MKTKISSNMVFATTIAAISTPPGKGGVAVIRICGKDALFICDKMFLPRGASVLKDKPRFQIYGDILYQGEVIDDGLATYFPAPNSYTGEDIVEISCHGGMLISRMVLESALICGASLAAPGEFTKRAFVNGKLSLTETEAVASLLEAESDWQVRLSRPSSRTKLAFRIAEIREELTSVLSSIYARIDYPDEDLGELTDKEIMDLISVCMCSISKLMLTYKTGRAVNEGINTVLCGKPNVGKSTLYNLLLEEDAAIVTNIPGTTRDVLEKRISLGKVMLKLFDTAGIRDDVKDTVESIGISRSREKIDSADLIFVLFDSSGELDEEDEKILEYVDKKSAAKVAVITKCDLAEKKNEKMRSYLSERGFEYILEISAKRDGDDARELLARLCDNLFIDEKIKIGDDAVISSARQYAALVKASEFLRTAYDAYSIGLPSDAASSDIELALGAISELDGRAVSETVVADIFSKFCVGK